MPREIPERVQVRVAHTLKWEPRWGNAARHTFRETTQVVRRPAHGAAEVAVACAECGHRHVFRIVDRKETRRLRVRQLRKPLAWSAGLAAFLVLLLNGVFGGSFVAIMAGFLAAIGLFVAVVCVFAFYLDELGIAQTNRRRISSADSAADPCIATTGPVRPRR